MKYIILFSVVIVAVLSYRSTIDDTIKELAKKITDAQVKRTTPPDIPFSYYQQKGTYPSKIRVNFFGSPVMQVLRQEFEFLDSNAFVTLWVSSILLEVTRFNKDLIPSDAQLLDAIKAISTYHDRNRLKENSILVFWPQVYNSSAKEWKCGPVNLNEVVKDSERLEDYVRKILKDVGMEKLWDKIEPIIDQLISITKAFQIPADFDDTFVNIGLGSLLKTFQGLSHQPYLSWLSNNTNISSAVYALKKYAYNPLSEDLDRNCIDPRSYFYLRNFLHEVLQDRQDQLLLVPTWIDDISQSRSTYYKGYSMPFNINNVDLTVSANVIYGLTSGVLSDLQDPKSWFDEEVQTIYDNTTLLIAYEISHNFSSRPDLALTYYPSMYNFYWFISRVLNLLNSYGSLPYPVLERAKERLNKALREDVTSDLLKRAKTEKNQMYFDDFLGDADTNIFGKRVNHGDDRICSTSMAVNALLYTWSEHNQLVPDLPPNVKDVLVRGCDWLASNALGSRYQHMNVFFSGSVKSVPQDFPFYFPMNYLHRLNGSSIPPSHVFDSNDTDVIGCVSGIIPLSEYNQMLKEKLHGLYVPMDFHGYNSGIGGFPFWSSESFTYASSLLALTQCKTLVYSIN